ncbi:phosphotransferase [Mycolicibacterium sp.]|uniref:phosphotransferase n=1 Tax=Mycolicibacterium sp. TaxID=2320850 RepID=UPI003D123D54
MPVPHPVPLCEEETVLGVPFPVTHLVPGNSLHVRAGVDGLAAATLSAVAAALVEALATLHAVDHREVGLAGFGRPTGYAQRQIRRWTEQWTLVGPAALTPAADELAHRLRQYAFSQERAVVVHGDYPIDNTPDRPGQRGRNGEGPGDHRLRTVDDRRSHCRCGDDVCLAAPGAGPHSRYGKRMDLSSAPSSRSPCRGLLTSQRYIFAALGRSHGARLLQSGRHRRRHHHRYRAGGVHGTGLNAAADAVPILLEAGLERI